MTEREDDQATLNSIVERIHEGDTLAEVIPQTMPDLLRFLRSERVTIYQKTRDNSEIVSRFKVEDEVEEIRLALSTTSIAGYVALTQRPLAVVNVRDAEELARINPSLRFDTSYDERSGFRTRSMLVLPVKYKDVMVGVLQAINRTGTAGGYTPNDLRRATALARLLGQKLRYELTLTSGPFEYLVQSRLVSREKLDEYIARADATGTTVSSLLITESHVLPTEVGESLERYYQIPYMPFDPEHVLPSGLLSGLKLQYLRQRMWIPVDGTREEAVVLLDNPADIQRIQEIQSVLGARNYQFRVGMPEDILAYLGDRIPFFEQEVQIGNTNVRELIQGLGREAMLARQDEENATAILTRGAGAIVEILNRIIFDAFQQRASDIHIEPGKEDEPTLIRYRIDGACHQMYRVPAAFRSALISRVKVVSELDISEKRRPQDGKLRLQAGDSKIELRVAILPTVNGESAVLRILARTKPLPLSELHISEASLERLQHIIEQPHGFMLVVGPTGSGKTTTLHAILRHINTPDKKIWTAEDPVEITQPGMQQMQIRHKIGLDFAAALRSFLRADPDIIMIGEMRDRETAAAMVEASLTGHLVFSTLHTNSAPETVIRLLGLGIEPAHFIDSFRGIMAQRLVRTLCEECKRRYRPDAAEIRQIHAYYGKDYADELKVDWDALELFGAVGCEHCHGSGYRGRMAIHELLTASPELNEAIYRGETGAAELFRIGMKTGMRTLIQDGITKLLDGHIDVVQLRKAVVT